MVVKVYMSIYHEPLSLIKDTVLRLLDIGYNNIQARLDGVIRVDVIDFLVKHGIDTYISDNLKQNKNNGALTHWYLTNFIQDDSVDYLIKIDPDTLPLRKLNYLPKINMLGTNISTKRETIFGGCIIFSKFVAKKIIGSDKLLHTYRTYYNNKLHKHIASQDMIIYVTCNKLGIKYNTMKNEICCLRQNFTTDKRFAFCHFN